MTRRFLVVIAVAVACGAPPETPVPAPPPLQDIIRRHWDQACQEGRDAPQAIQVSELFDTVGLGDELDAKGLRPQTRVREHPSLDFVTRYRADGSIAAMGVFDFSTDTARAVELESVLRGRVREMPRLLEPTGFRSHLELTPMPRLSLGSPIVCMPHIVHRDGAPPPGLPDSVRTWAGGVSVRPGNDTTVEVSIQVDQDGVVTSIQRRRGGESAFVAASEVIRALSFDPPLRNGEAISDELVQSFRFRRSADLPAHLADSLFLAARGFTRRAEAFPALMRVGRFDSASAAVPSEVLRGVANVRIEAGTTGTHLTLGGAGGGCPVAVLVNGALTGSGTPGYPGDIDAVAARAGLTGLELYDAESTPVPDSLGCGTLLLWSRSFADVVDQPLLAVLNGTVLGLEGQAVRSWTTRVVFEPGGHVTSVSRGGRFRMSALPGAYEVVVTVDGERLWSDRIVLKAGPSTVELDTRRR